MAANKTTQQVLALSRWFANVKWTKEQLTLRKNGVYFSAMQFCHTASIDGGTKMARTLYLSEETYNRLQAIAIPFEDKTPEDVILRLLDEKGGSQRASTAFVVAEAERTTSPFRERSATANLPGREPRERGVTVRIANQVIKAVSVPDLYLQAMKWLVFKGYIQKLDTLIPFPTSQRRYLIAKQPVHPQGNNFVSPVDYNGYYMEAHKNYKNAISSLKKLLAKIGVTVEYLENG